MPKKTISEKENQFVVNSENTEHTLVTVKAIAKISTVFFLAMIWVSASLVLRMKIYNVDQHLKIRWCR